MSIYSAHFIKFASYFIDLSPIINSVCVNLQFSETRGRIVQWEVGCFIASYRSGGTSGGFHEVYQEVHHLFPHRLFRQYLTAIMADADIRPPKADVCQRYLNALWIN